MPPQMATIKGGTNNDSLSGSSEDDTISVFFGADLLAGGDGNDTLVGDGVDGVSAGAIGQFYFEFFNAPDGNPISSVNQIPDSEPAATGYVSDTDVDALAAIYAEHFHRGSPCYFGIRWSGTIEVQSGQSGTYMFSTASDDGASL